MKTRFDARLVVGPLLILIGALFLLQNMGALGFLGALSEALWALLWTGIFGIAGLGFLMMLLLNQENWWAAIPGFALLGLSGTILTAELLPGFPLVGSIFLGSLALGFLVVYILHRENWWAIIPSGVLLTLAVVAGLDELVAMDTGAIFFLGLGATFVLVGLLPTSEGRMTWAFIPAAVLLGLGVIIAASFQSFMNLLWGILLIGFGLLLIYRNFFRPQRQ